MDLFVLLFLPLLNFGEVLVRSSFEVEEGGDEADPFGAMQRTGIRARREHDHLRAALDVRVVVEVVGFLVVILIHFFLI